MICQDCKKKEAVVHFTQIINNEKTSLSLCKSCAAARGFHSPLDNMPFPLAEILSGLDANLPKSKEMSAEETVTCPTCGLSFKEFTQQGRFGCGECYSTFRNRLEMIMRKIHGASMHRGKNPTFTSSADESENTHTSVKEEERLKEELQKAIDSEDFERAAELRDKLKTLRESLAAN
ncbi:MAG: hypothetical protein DWP97_03700 [Calditrichaeota bacterium]|nr:MAG: hypothetical protein DWP97_03700 [Calditrichota bacterium]